MYQRIQFLITIKTVYQLISMAINHVSIFYMVTELLDVEKKNLLHLGQRDE